MKPKELASALKEYEDYLVGLRRHFHQYPESSGLEKRTAEKIAECLTAIGLRPRLNVGGGYGLCADLPVKGRCAIALRADMDALLAQEENSLPFKSAHPGTAHLCGHDAHMATLLTVARFLYEHSAELTNGVRFIFQPHEENAPGGAAGMIRDGVLEGVEEIYALHYMSMYPTGTFAIKDGPLMAASDHFEASILGQGGHAATPHLTRDPVVTAAQCICAMQTLVSRETAPDDSLVVSVCTLNAGSAFNIIPERVRLSGTVRTLSKELFHNAPEMLERVLKGITQASGLTYEFKYTRGYPITANHKQSVEKVLRALRDIFSENKIVCPCRPIMGGEDFSYYLEKTKGAFIFAGCSYPDRKENPPLHSAKFELDENALIPGAALLIALALA